MHLVVATNFDFASDVFVPAPTSLVQRIDSEPAREFALQPLEKATQPEITQLL